MISRDEIYDTVNDIIQKLEDILEKYNPLEIIGSISKHTATFDLQDYSDSENMLWHPFIEYLMSLSLSKPMPVSPENIDNATIEVVIDLWKQLINNFTAYYGSEFVDEKGDPEAAIRFKLILEYFAVRGKAQLLHVETSFLELFRPHKEHLIKTLGFSADDFNDFVHNAETQIKTALQKELDSVRILGEFYFRFNDWTKNQEIEKDSREEIMGRFIKENPYMKKQKEQIETLSKIKAFNGFEILPADDLCEKILDTISCTFGKNDVFLSHAKTRGWPTNDTIISDHPIIKYEGEYYLFHFPMLARNRIEIMETLLKEKSPQYYKNKYLPKRDQYAEDITLGLLKKLLPDSAIYSNLHYHIIENGKTNQAELDGLILYDDCLLLVETKAGMLPLPAKRGSIKGLKQKVKKILKKGHDQANRALEYIESSSKVDFFDEDGNLIVSVERNRFFYRYLILTTLEPLSVLTSHLSSTKKLGLLSGGIWPWAVYINDLRIIADIIDHPSTFLHYLNRRIALNDYPAVETFDEIDYFEYYRMTGLFFSQEQLDQHDSIVIVPSTIEIDEYYNDLKQFEDVKNKPRFKMEPTFEELIHQLEKESPIHFTSACFHLLNCDEDTRSEIAKQIRFNEKRFYKDKKPNSVGFRINGTALLLGCMSDLDDYDEFVENWAKKWIRNYDVTDVTVIIWCPPIENGQIRTFQFKQ